MRHYFHRVISHLENAFHPTFKVLSRASVRNYVKWGTPATHLIIIQMRELLCGELIQRLTKRLSHIRCYCAVAPKSFVSSRELTGCCQLYAKHWHTYTQCSKSFSEFQQIWHRASDIILLELFFLHRVM